MILTPFEQLKNRIDMSKLRPEYKEWLDDELYFFDCNPEACDYYLYVMGEIKSKNIDMPKNKNNSILAYLLGLTKEEPVAPISASPTTLPDIDYDTNARDEVKNYLVYKYGINNVTLMGTNNSLKTKGAIKDVLRRLRSDMNFKEVNELTKHYDKLKRVDYKTEEDYLNAGIKEVPELNNYFAQNPDVLDAVKGILNALKTNGIHAGGIVVSGVDVRTKVSCRYERKKDHMYVTEPDMKYVEWAGLIKYDFLGLNTLNDIDKCLRLIEKRFGKRLSMSSIPKNDATVMRLFQKGDSMSIFQFGTFLAHSILVQLKDVKNIIDLAIITSIARPGPLEMGMDKVYIKRVNGEEEVKYVHEALEPILKDTYGIIVFQETVQEIMKKIGGLSKNESVVVLKAMGKKQLDKLEKFKKQFLENAYKTIPGMDEQIEYNDPETNELVSNTKAEYIYKFCEAFAKYGFNKSHAVAYATVSYICMWLKHYYKIEWITAVLSNSDKDDFKQFYGEWNRFITKPDINRSKAEYSIEKIGSEDKTIMPFSFINGLGDKAVIALVDKQPFFSFEDFITRIDMRKINKTSIVNLITSGVFDSLNKNEAINYADFRKQCVRDFFTIRDKIKKTSKKDKEDAQEIIKEMDQLTRGQLLMKEVSLLNLTAFDYYDFYKDYARRESLKNYGLDPVTPEIAKKMDNNADVVVIGAIESIKYIVIQNGKNKGKEMARLKIINKEFYINCTVFANFLERDFSGKNPIRDLEAFTPVLIKGRIQKDEKYGSSITFSALKILT